MKNLISFLTLIFLLSTAQAQKKPELVEEYYDNGQLKFTGREYPGSMFSDPIPDGEWKFYTLSGQLWKTGTYDKGVQVGIWYNYENKNGTMSKKEEFTGAGKSFYQEFYGNGQIKKVGNKDHGKEVGEWKVYYEDGTLGGEGNYKLLTDDWVLGTDYKSYKDGDWKFFYKDGSIARIENYRNNRQTGVWKYYNENGELSKAIDYDLFTGEFLIQGAIYGLASEEDRIEGQYLKNRSEDRNNTIAKATAYLMLAEKYWNIEGEVASSVDYYKKSANMGNEEAQFYLGKLYLIGFLGGGVEKDITKAIYWFEKAAENDHVDAQYNLGVLYYSGNDVAKDVNSAAKWFKKAAENGNANAQYYLGVFYQNGDGVEKDISQAIKWLEKSVQNGRKDAAVYFLLGLAFNEGEGVDVNKQKAINHYEKAILTDPEMSDAYFNLGVLYYNTSVQLLEQADKVPSDDNENYNELISKSNQELALAKPYFEKYLKLKPGNKNAETALLQIKTSLKSQENTKLEKPNEGSSEIPSKPGKSEYSDVQRIGCLSGDCNNGYGVYKFEDNDIYEGEWKSRKMNGHGTYYFHDTGNIYIGSQKDSQNNGKGTLFFANGERLEGEWLNDIKNGVSKYYYANGQLKSTGNFILGEKTGDWKYYTDKGEFKGTETFKNGKNDGLVIYYYPNGQERFSVNMIDDKRIGDEKGYYENGEIRYFTKYREGKKIFYKGYHPNGQLSYEANYKDGSRNGIAKWYYPNGNIESIIEYKSNAGVESGLRWNALESFNSDGGLRDHGTLLNGNGTLISYGDNGEITKIVEYQGGIEINRKEMSSK